MKTTSFITLFVGIALATPVEKHSLVEPHNDIPTTAPRPSNRSDSDSYYGVPPPAWDGPSIVPSQISEGTPITPSTAARAAACTNTALAPGPTQAGVVQGCAQWYVTQSGDICYSIAQRFGIPVDTFMQWNPAVNPPSCSSLWAGYAYCVAICDDSAPTAGPPASSPSTRSSASATITLTRPTAPMGPFPRPVDRYTAYTGDGTVAAGWPSFAKWISFQDMWEANLRNLRIGCSQYGVPNNSDDELFNLRIEILRAGSQIKMDARFILAVVLQESTGCVRVITTRYDHANPGLMQSFQGTGSCNANTAPIGQPGTSLSLVQTPCPATQIQRMILDGSNGTAAGPGLYQNWVTQGARDESGFYRTIRVYNGGSVDPSGNLEAGCCTASYASDIANRLTGWVNAPKSGIYA